MQNFRQPAAPLGGGKPVVRPTPGWRRGSPARDQSVTPRPRRPWDASARTARVIGAALLREDLVLPWVWVGLFAILLSTAAIPTDLRGQAWIACGVLLVLLVMRKLPLSELGRALFLLLGTYLTARYVFWRTFSTLTYYDPLSFAGAILLYLAELFGIVLYLLSTFVNISPLKRVPVPWSADPAQLPSVDVLVPTYNESPELLEVTLLAALQIRYPRDKLRIYLLDDGGTVQKRNDAAPGVAKAAWERHRTLRAMCERAGAHYITREKNEHAKAGNLNAALKVTHGELILVLDADHVPTVDILEKTVGLFERDSKLFLVQTPHFFINPDPIEKHNSKVFGAMPGENEMFYSIIQHGLDFWNSSFFCGSAAVLRRAHLEEVGGISCSTITEDAETSMNLHNHGYNSAYIDHPMISGLQPETYTDFIVQRLRWAQGMVQIFVLKNPLFRKRLRFWQRLSYLSGSFFWFFGYARVVFLLAPAAYLLLGLRIYDANLREFLAYALPHLIAATLVANYLFGKVRWPFVSEIYEIMQSLFSLPAIFRVLLNPHAPKFMVTPKGEQISQDFLSRLSGPFYLIYMVTVVAIAAGGYRYFNFPAERDTIYITMAWELLNLILLNAAMGALFESKQRRGNHRMRADMAGQLLISGHPALDCEINDLSHRGALLRLRKSAFDSFTDVSSAEIRAYNVALGKFTTLPINVCNSRPLGDEMLAVGTEFLFATQEQKAEAVALAHGDSERWVNMRRERGVRQGILKSFLTMVMLGTKYAAVHFALVFEIVFSLIIKGFKTAVRDRRITAQRIREAPVALRQAVTRAYKRRRAGRHGSVAHRPEMRIRWRDRRYETVTASGG